MELDISIFHASNGRFKMALIALLFILIALFMLSIHKRVNACEDRITKLESAADKSPGCK